MCKINQILGATLMIVLIKDKPTIVFRHVGWLVSTKDIRGFSEPYNKLVVGAQDQAISFMTINILLIMMNP
jgi:hypothetical protein